MDKKLLGEYNWDSFQIFLVNKNVLFCGNQVSVLNRDGGAGNYKYYGYFYMIGVDDIYPESRAGMTVNYKTDEKPAEVKEFDEETLSIIKSLKIKTNA